MFFKTSIEWNALFLIILGIILESGVCQLSDDKFSFCRGFSSLNFTVSGGVDPKLKYLLYTRSNKQDACDLQPTEEAFKSCNFNPNHKTAIIVHGWTTRLQTYSEFFTIKDNLLQVDDYNVVVLDWTAYSNSYFYDFAIVNSEYVALKLSSWIHFLQIHGANTSNFHFISHSLGCVLTHLAVQPFCSVGRMTYLDAAGPRFRTTRRSQQPSNTDATFVDAIHTNGALTDSGGNGLMLPFADIDFYPNGGQTQPKCVDGAKYRNVAGDIDTVTSSSTKNYCSHDLAFSYFVSSFKKTCQFLGRICDSYEDFTAGKCSSAPVCRMGFYSKKIPNLPVHSKCYLNTSSSFPYCLGYSSKLKNVLN